MEEGDLPPEGTGSEEEEVETREEQLARLNPPMLSAVVQNNGALAIDLIGQMADPLAEDARQWSPLLWASNHGNEELTRFLIGQGAAETYAVNSYTLKKHSPL